MHESKWKDEDITDSYYNESSDGYSAMYRVYRVYELDARILSYLKKSLP